MSHLVSNSESPLLQVRSLKTEFSTPSGTVHAVRGVDLDVRGGERVGIVGESGSGKTALALSILGLIDPPGRVVSGSICLKGRELWPFDERRLNEVRGKEIALVFQDPMTALDPIQTIGRQIGEALRSHSSMSRRKARQSAIGLMQEVGISSAARRVDNYPHQYSGGMRQRVMIAVALANQPDLIIADEPTTALDVTSQAQILDLLTQICRDRGTAIVLITHNLGIVAGFCDYVFVMYAGRIVEHSPVRELFAHPVHPYTEALLRSVPRSVAEGESLYSIPGSPPDLARLGRGCPFAPRCDRGRNEPRCANEDPATFEAMSTYGPVMAECNFAEERFALVAQQGPGHPS